MRLRNILRAYAYVLGALSLGITLISYHADDPTLLYSAMGASSPENWLGAWGAKLSACMLYFFGSAAHGFIPLFFVQGWRTLRPSMAQIRIWPLVMLIVLSAITGAFLEVEWYRHVSPGGFFGKLLLSFVLRFLDVALVPVVLFFSLWLLFVLLFGFTWVQPLMRALHRLSKMLRFEQLFYWTKAFVVRKYEAMWSRICAYCSSVWQSWWPPTISSEQALERLVYETFVLHDPVQQYSEEILEDYKEVAVEGVEDQNLDDTLVEIQAQSTYVKPRIKSLHPHNPAGDRSDRQELQAQAQILEEKLKRFGIRGTVINITAGPVVTLFEYQPNIDVPVSKVIAREDDLALALQALSLRIIAPIPGKSVIGFEVSNLKRKTVLFAECVVAPEFTMTTCELPLIIGQNTIGEQAIIDLAKMPHLLVAGSTGSGKSVALNSMLISLLCHATPDEVRLILIDPKRLEFTAYADIPHLMFPVITDPTTAMAVLDWTLQTMEERYTRMAEVGVRNLYDYRAKQQEPLPYIVVVIDELADLMMVGGKEIEGSIARLAQMARAAGIHLVIATQRPSVDVITGVVKVNFPARIACKVTSKIDSRTILDVGGAEKLLGKGDMLFLDPQGKLNRLHGAYVTDQEIVQVVEHIKAQREVRYETLPEVEKDCAMRGEDAALYQDLLHFVKTVDEVSISLLQRKFSIGYNRSARMIDILESQGVIMPSSGGKTRKVLH